MRKHRLGVTLLLAAMGGAAACGETLVEPEAGTRLVLETVQSRLLPVSVEESPGYTRVYRADTVTLLTDDTWTRVQVQDLIRPDGGTQAIRWESDGFVRKEGTQIILDFECDDLALCVAPDRLVPDADRYRIEHPLGDTDTLVFHYRVIPAPEEPAV